jgi:hypothetical protein
MQIVERQRGSLAVLSVPDQNGVPAGALEMAEINLQRQ